MKRNLTKIYNAEFFAQQSEGSLRSANVILALLYTYFQPASVIDIGCGQGAWLSVAEKLGSKKLKGVDGNWVNQDALLSRNIDFTSTHLEEGFEIDKKYDLCMSLEVAEHLPECKAKRFVQTLCKASNVVLFSAAIQHQGGTHHLNEQWPSYWVQRFEENGYQCFDILRKQVWTNREVQPWYRQNILLFLNAEGRSRFFKHGKTVSEPPLDMALPEVYEDKTARIEELLSWIQKPSLRFILGCTKRYIQNIFKKS